MENASHDEDFNVREFFKKLLAQRDQQIENLQKELAAAQTATQNALAERGMPETEVNQKFAKLEKTFEQQNARAQAQIEAQKSQIVQLNETIRQTNEGYQNLRRQKGGFGMFTVLMSLLTGFLLGFVVNKLFFTHRDPQAVVFEKFRNEHQFNLEYQISQGQFDKVELTLKELQVKREFSSIQHELEFFKKMMGATRRKLGLSEANPTGEFENFVVNPTVAEANILTKAKSKLTITEAEVTLRSEASTSGDKLGKLKKGETVGVWDRTLAMDKIVTLLDGKRIEVQDFWYKVEAPDGMEGWVFGYFTNRAQNRFSYLDPPPAADSLAAPKPVPASTNPASAPANGGQK